MSDIAALEKKITDAIASANDEAALEAIEWQLTHAAQEAAHHYLESVVLPAIHHAEEK